MAELLFGRLLTPAARVIDDESSIEALMPKLRHSDYYTKPTIEELVAKERAQPGYCGRGIWNFVVGHHGVGSIKFIGEIDVRRLDLESFFTFEDDGRFLCRINEKQPLIGYNYTAEITMHAEKFYTNYIKDMEDQGLRCVSYDSLTKKPSSWNLLDNKLGSV
ncbi:hypothetical protein OSB04_029578 [Centaurea solstitialis]|uniref:Peptidase S59 domain-containing protein n=1 Tax=Centaurea solstitialis TaxID=347529 RepID=A0AA38SIL2_9ASTR|nr:hypothetical protein OSB04_029578 [Centaurea solstitialis]